MLPTVSELYEYPWYVSIVLSASSALLSEAVTYPIDYIKLRTISK